MKISDLGEFGLIDRIGKTAPRNAKRAPIGIGDDAAALLLSPASILLAATDMLIEGVHFDLKTTDLYSLGWKAAAVNLSDIAAMGGVPRFCLTALGIPSSLTVEQVDEFYRGFSVCIRKQGTVLVGGDTCSSPKGLIISVTVLGEAEKKHAITRSGARPGDLLYVTGTLGDSGAGLEILKSGSGVRGQGSGEKRILKSAIRVETAPSPFSPLPPGERGRGEGHVYPQSAIMRLIERHLRPVPRVAEGRKLALSGLASAMIDISDGLSSDLGHLCAQSRVGAEVFAERIPLSKELRAATALKLPILSYALSGGEDYELLFTSPAEMEREIMSLRIRATVIGAITRKKGMRMVTEKGDIHPLVPGGYDHFLRLRRRGSVR
jgi:thiamine-monophosphate kinase